MALRLKALDHVGIRVSDLERSLRFYVDGLGMELLRRREGAAVLRIGAQEINMFCAAQAGAAEAPAPIDHFCLTVDYADGEALAAALAAAGIAVARGPLARRDGVAFFVSDPDGTKVELQIKTAA
ncbi:MAG TPA: VOC family protein [Stellaceae bacterium]|nr:VOC family protein [Stellaceae bacterium]